MMIRTQPRAFLVTRPAACCPRKPVRLSTPLHAVPSAFKVLYEDVNGVMQSSTKPLPKDAILDLLDAITQPEHVKQLITLLKLEAPRYESRAQKDWPFRMRVYKELAAKAVQLGSPTLLARMVEDSSELQLEKYFVKYLLQDLAQQGADFTTMELILEAYRGHAKEIPALRKGLRGAYYETMLVAHKSGLYNKFLGLYSQGLEDGVEFSDGIKRAVTRLKNAPPPASREVAPDQGKSSVEGVAATEEVVEKSKIAASVGR